MARYSLGHRLPGGFSGRVYFGSWGSGGRRRGVGTRRRPFVTQNTNLNLTLTPEALREIRLTEAQNYEQAKGFWKGAGVALLVMVVFAFVVQFWYVILALVSISAISVSLVRRKAARTSDYTYPLWYRLAVTAIKNMRSR